MTTYNIAPTDLTFLYQECPRCFYNKIHKTWTRPWTGFPSIFSKIDKCMRLALHDKSCEPLLGRPGVFDTSDRKIRSRPIQVGGHDIVFSGKMDVRANFDDCTVGVIDDKTSEPSDSSMKIYERQLHSYYTILTQPEKGEPEVVSMMGLAIVTPEWWEFNPLAETSPFHFRLAFKAVEINEKRWNKTLTEVVELLSGPRPEPTGKCSWCTMQRAEEIMIVADF